MTQDEPAFDVTQIPIVSTPGFAEKLLEQVVSALQELEDEDAVCSRCGCSESHACQGGCMWASYEPMICTTCVKPDEVLENPITADTVALYFAALGKSMHESVVAIDRMQDEIGKMVNLLIVMVRRNGGAVRLPKGEFDEIADMRIDSWFDEARNEQVLETTRLDPDTGQPSSLIIPGRLPLIVP